MTIDEVRIGGYTYRVRWHDGLLRDQRAEDEAEGALLNGQILYEDCEIHVSRAVSPQVRRAVLLHETIHGCLWYAGHADQDENQVQALGNMLLQVLRGNPRLVAYLMEEDKEDGRKADCGAGDGAAAQPEGDGGAGISGGDADHDRDPGT